MLESVNRAMIAARSIWIGSLLPITTSPECQVYGKTLRNVRKTRGVGAQLTAMPPGFKRRRRSSK